jgi:ribose-phosphate pyrophosphokinase
MTALTAPSNAMTDVGGLQLFALDATAEYGARVAARLEVPLSPHQERVFEDGEHKTRPLASVMRRDVFVIQSLYADAAQSVNDKLCRLLFFVGALKDAGADRVTVVAPYLCYARKDQKTQPQDPVITKYVAELFEAAGADAVITIDVHNVAAFQNAFRCRTDHLEAWPLFVEHFAETARHEDVVVMSPDIGGVKRADQVRRALAEATHREPGFAIMEKRRSGGVVSGDLLAGDVANRTVILIDDMISTGTTLRRAAHACRDAGAKRVFAAATHGLLHDGALDVLSDSAFEGTLITDTVRARSLADGAAAVALIAAAKLTVLDSTGLIADAIAASHTGQ